MKPRCSRTFFRAPFLLVTFLLSLADAKATVLTFDFANPRADWAALPQGYGSRVRQTNQDGFLYSLEGGATPNIEVLHSTDGMAQLYTWTTGFGDLVNSCFAAEPYRFRMKLVADPGFQVQLNGFDMAVWDATGYTINSVAVFGADATTALWSQASVYIPGDLSASEKHRHFSFTNVVGSQILIEFDSTNVDSDDVSIDNIAFSQPRGPGHFALAQLTYRAGGGPCTGCCGIDHRQPIMSPDGGRVVFSSTWNVDDYTGNLNPERNRELFSYSIASNKFQQLTRTTNGMSLPCAFQGSKVSFISCSPDFGGNPGTNMQVFGYDLDTLAVTQWVNTAGPAPVALGTNCPYAWFTPSDWTNLGNLQADLSADQQHLVWASNRDLPSVGYPTGNNADGNYEIYSKNLGSGQVRQLTGTTGGDNVSSAAAANLWPRTSADGSKIVFVSNRELTGSPISSNRYGLFVADTRGTIRRLTTAEIEVAREFPACGMDQAGTRVVFGSDADLIGSNTNRTPQIYALDLNTSRITQITQTGDGVTNSRPILSGDGSKVAFLSNGNLSGTASNKVEQLWVYHFDADPSYSASFIQITSCDSNQPATEGRISWADWYSFDFLGSNLVFTCNADLVNSNSGNAYEVFLASFGWQPFTCKLISQGSSQYRLEWTSAGNGSYTVESCTSLVDQVWTPVSPTNQWPTSATSWTNNFTPGEPSRFFRVRAY